MSSYLCHEVIFLEHNFEGHSESARRICSGRMSFVERVRIFFHEIFRFRLDDFGEPENETSTQVKNAQYARIAQNLTNATRLRPIRNIEPGNVSNERCKCRKRAITRTKIIFEVMWCKCDNSATADLVRWCTGS